MRKANKSLPCLSLQEDSEVWEVELNYLSQISTRSDQWDY